MYIANTMASAKDMLVKAAVTGAVFTGAAVLYTGDVTGTIPLFGVNLPVLAATTAVGAGASLIADIGYGYVFPELPGNERWARAEAAALGPALAGAGLIAILAAADQLPRGMAVQLAVMAGGAEALGSYTYENFVKSLAE